MLKVDAQGLPALPLADSDELRQGHVVFAFGSPLGLDNSVTMGIVSAVGRQREPDDPMVYVQTDAPINPGSSGGPLVDAAGRVVGINTFILSQSGGNQGLGFAAPSNIVRTVFEQIKTTGRVRRGTLGVVAQTITPMLAAGLRSAAHRAASSSSDVAPGGPGAHRPASRPGDVVLALDGKRDGERAPVRGEPLSPAASATSWRSSTSVAARRSAPAPRSASGPTIRRASPIWSRPSRT